MTNPLNEAPPAPAGADADGPSRFQRKFAAIVAADVAGYSRLIAEDEEGALQLFSRCRVAFDAEISRFGGRIFNTAGDSVMSEFASVVEAVRASIAIQRALQPLNAAHAPGKQVLFRIGVNVGDVIERDGDLLGDGVNIAARLQTLAEPGGVCVSRIVREAAAGKVSAEFRDLGLREVKNIPEPVHAFTIDMGPSRHSQSGTGAGKPGAGIPSLLFRRRRLLGAVALLGVFAGTVILAHSLLQEQLGLKPAASVATNNPTMGAPQEANKKRAEPPTHAPMPPAQAAQLSRQWEQLRQSAAPVAQPDTAAEFYYNARLAEAGGDTDGARRGYIEALRRGPQFVDPQMRLATLMRRMVGPAATRALLADLRAIVPGETVETTYATQLSQPEQLERLTQLTRDNPDHLPGWRALAGALDEETRPTLTQRRLEYAALDRLLAGDQAGALAQYFLDQSVRNAWVAAARKRRDAISASFTGEQTRPSLSFVPGANGWTVRVALPEEALAVQYRLGERGGFSRAELEPASATAPGGRSATFSLPNGAGKATIYLSYKDKAGQTAGPFPFIFDPTAQAEAREKALLLSTTGSWLTWAEDRDEIFFGHLLNYRCAVRAAYIGFDDQQATIPLPLPPADCNGGSATARLGVQTSIPAPHDARKVSVRLVFVDGDASGDVAFQRP